MLRRQAERVQFAEQQHLQEEPAATASSRAALSETIRQAAIVTVSMMRTIWILISWI